MSGIAGSVGFDGALRAPDLAERQALAIAPRGPDGTSNWSDDRACLIQAHFKTTREAADEEQPLTVDGSAWITADARIDGRDDLRRELRGAGRDIDPGAADAELVLHAYLAWGTECAGRLLGDFAFAIWDAHRRRLYCARDYLGLRPFFFARFPGGVAFGSCLGAVTAIDGFDARLDDSAVSDFLLFGRHTDGHATIYRGARRLPAAHFLVCDAQGLLVRRYWDVPEEPRLNPRRGEDLVDEFRDLLDRAVADRLRGDRVAIHMSGGLDSTSVAATAQAVSRRAGNTLDLHAFAVVYERLFHDVERSWVLGAARLMELPLQLEAIDDQLEFQAWLDGRYLPEEPGAEPMAGISLELARRTAAHSRVVLTGYGGDPILYPEADYALGELASPRRWAFLREVAAFMLAGGGPPPLYLKSKLASALRLSGDKPPQPPPWIDSQLSSDLHLAERWRAETRPPHLPHPLRQVAAGITFSSGWQHIMSSLDFVHPGTPALEYRHPFLDRRLVEFMLRVPPLPWCIQKHILRLAMRGRLPEPIRTRPKMSLSGTPIHQRAHEWREVERALLDDLPAAGGYLTEALAIYQGSDHTRQIPNVYGNVLAFLWWNRTIRVNYQSTGRRREMVSKCGSSR